MFGRIFGRRKSPVEGDTPTESGLEATEERPDQVNNDGFIVIDNTGSQSNTIYDPPPGYSLEGATAFLNYVPTGPGSVSQQRTQNTEPQTAIDGVPFKLGSKILLEGSTKDIDISSATQVIERINSFDWDDYEYSFQLERSILQEFHTAEIE